MRLNLWLSFIILYLGRVRLIICQFSGYSEGHQDVFEEEGGECCPSQCWEERGTPWKIGSTFEEGQTLRIEREDSDSGEMITDDVMHIL